MRSTQAFASRITLLAGALSPFLAFGMAPTVTTLSVSPSGPVALGTAIALSAKVLSGAAGATGPIRGTVSFCNADAAHCMDSAILGHAQVTADGAAGLKLRLGLGVHNIRAVFQGTTLFAASPSDAEQITVSGIGETTTKLYLSNDEPSPPYTFVGTVNAFGPARPTGSLALTDSNHNNASIGSIPLSPQNTALGFVDLPRVQIDANHNMVPGDFNGDGIPDLAVDGETTLKIWIGKGDGTFTITSPGPSSGGYNTALVTEDFNADGRLDLAMANGDGSVRMLIGDGAGGFTRRDSPSSPGVVYLKAGDFNGDGIIDLAQGVINGPNIAILLGNGDGTFNLQPAFDIGSDLSALVVADFNADGLSDLATALYDNTVKVRLSNGAGAFPVKSSTDIGRFPIAITSGDFNGDGVADLVADGQINGYDAILTAMLGNADGTFITKSSYVTNGTAVEMHVADFNSDGKSDLVIGLDIFGFILAGVGDGTFKVIYNSGDSLVTAVADYNGDGAPDLATDHYSGSPNHQVTISLIDMTSRLSLTTPLPPGIYHVAASYSGDANYAGSRSSPVNFEVPTAPPVFVPPAGVYQWTQKVALTDSTPGAVIYYTLDGSQPTTASPKYTTPIVVTWDQIILAFATSPGAADSPIFGGGYSILRPMKTPTFSPPPGTYDLPQTISITPDPDYCSHATCTIYYTRDGSTPTTSSIRYTGPVPLSSSGTTTIKAIATSHHFSPSPVASAIYQALHPITTAPVFAPAAGVYQWTQKISINDATPGAVIHYTLDGTDPTTSSAIFSTPITVDWDANIKVIAAAPGSVNSPIVSAAYSIERPIPPPTFSLPSGSYPSPQTIALSAEPSYCDQAICVIHYTLNGSTPNTNSKVYTGPLVLNSTATIQAIATSHHFKSSTVASAAYMLPMMPQGCSNVALRFDNVDDLLQGSIANSGTSGKQILSATYSSIDTGRWISVPTHVPDQMSSRYN